MLFWELWSGSVPHEQVDPTLHLPFWVEEKLYLQLGGFGWILTGIDLIGIDLIGIDLVVVGIDLILIGKDFLVEICFSIQLGVFYVPYLFKTK